MTSSNVLDIGPEAGPPPWWEHEPPEPVAAHYEAIWRAVGVFCARSDGHQAAVELLARRGWAVAPADGPNGDPLCVAVEPGRLWWQLIEVGDA